MHNDDFYQVSVVPKETPISLNEAKDTLRIKASVIADDALVTALISTVVAYGEKFTNRQFVTRTLEGFFAGLQVSRRERYQFIELLKSPFASVTSVEVSVGGVLTAFTDFVVKNSTTYARLLFPNGIDLSVDTDVAYPYKATFVAGYGDAPAVPDDIKTALKAHISFLYENRGDAIAEGDLAVPLETKLLYKQYRITRFFG